MERVALVSCILKYQDIEIYRVVKPKEQLTVSVERAKKLINNNPRVCELISIE